MNTNSTQTTTPIIVSSLEDALENKKISQKTYDRVKVAKDYIERKYKSKKYELHEKQAEWEMLIGKIKELGLEDLDANKIKKEILKKDAEDLRLKRGKLYISNYKPICIIGKGAFGEVRVCEDLINKEIVAVKKLKKEEMFDKREIFHVKAEKEVLSEFKNEWIVNLKATFQDEENLYFIMEFLEGGDLMNLLMLKDIITEDEAAFYIAETLLALETIHKKNIIHRDIKPDNILISSNGHIKISDFGLCKMVDFELFSEKEKLKKEIKEREKDEKETKESSFETNNGIGLGFKLNAKKKFEITSDSKGKNYKEYKRLWANSTVGTPDYIAPEVFKKAGYGPEVDYWSLGIMLYEMLIGYPPFFSDSATETCKKILNWKENLSFPSKPIISHQAKDLILRLVTNREIRIGKENIDEIKSHPFFSKIDFQKIKSTIPPFIPECDLSNPGKYFDSFDEEEPFIPISGQIREKVKEEKLKEINKLFVGFGYRCSDEKNNIIAALEVLDSLNENNLISSKGMFNSQQQIIEEQSECIDGDETINNERVITEIKVNNDYEINDHKKCKEKQFGENKYEDSNKDQNEKKIIYINKDKYNKHYNKSCDDAIEKSVISQNNINNKLINKKKDDLNIKLNNNSNINNNINALNSQVNKQGTVSNYLSKPVNKSNNQIIILNKVNQQQQIQIQSQQPQQQFVNKIKSTSQIKSSQLKSSFSSSKNNQKLLLSPKNLTKKIEIEIYDDEVNNKRRNHLTSSYQVNPNNKPNTQKIKAQSFVNSQVINLNNQSQGLTQINHITNIYNINKIDILNNRVNISSANSNKLVTNKVNYNKNNISHQVKFQNSNNKIVK